MNTRVLLVFALVAAILASWLYKEQGSLDNPIAIASSNIEYEATDINALQTNALGEVAYLLKADKLIHYTDINTDELENIRLNWRSDQQQNIQLRAKLANINHETGDIQMTQDVILVTQHPTPTVANSNVAHIPLNLTATVLNGNLQHKTLYSEQPVIVTQGDNRFEANSFRTDLQTGEYEFDQVAVTFQPPSRQDTALF
ncbi:LPS export ABC transporter periplasmic protein LptC [Psychrobacter sp. I-STPA10]|uniref:LPS export ABC transporter periplasmic protein LptC n=1 Tax=Psychrobacter sp. I-STPA10 TaxID=2585769 RepID=UPI001E4D6B69|nr:LPS export ABC transporter periplasmic protein LptC [Psychrobacter sp. I-STPA10]